MPRRGWDLSRRMGGSDVRIRLALLALLLVVVSAALVVHRREVLEAQRERAAARYQGEVRTALARFGGSRRAVVPRTAEHPYPPFALVGEVLRDRIADYDITADRSIEPRIKSVGPKDLILFRTPIVVIRSSSDATAPTYYLGSLPVAYPGYDLGDWDYNYLAIYPTHREGASSASVRCPVLVRIDHLTVVDDGTIWVSFDYPIARQTQQRAIVGAVVRDAILRYQRGAWMQPRSQGCAPFDSLTSSAEREWPGKTEGVPVIGRLHGLDEEQLHRSLATARHGSQDHRVASVRRNETA